MKNPTIQQIKDFCELQLKKDVQDEFDHGVSWLASVIIDVIAEEEFRLEYPLTYEEQ